MKMASNKRGNTAKGPTSSGERDEKSSKTKTPTSGSQSILGMFKRQKDIQRRISELEEKDKEIKEKTVVHLGRVNQRKETDKTSPYFKDRKTNIDRNCESSSKLRRTSEEVSGEKNSRLTLKRKSGGKCTSDKTVAKGAGDNNEDADSKSNLLKKPKVPSREEPKEQTSVLSLDKSPSKLPKGQSRLSLGKRKRNSSSSISHVSSDNGGKGAGNSSFNDNSRLSYSDKDLDSECSTQPQNPHMTRKSLSEPKLGGDNDAECLVEPLPKKRRQHSKAGMLPERTKEVTDNFECKAEHLLETERQSSSAHKEDNQSGEQVKVVPSSSAENSQPVNLAAETNNDDVHDVTPSSSKPSAERSIQAQNKNRAEQDEEFMGDGGADESGEEEEEDGEVAEGEELYRVPYYLENFLLVLETVLEDDYYSHLFDEEDRKTVQVFYGLTEPAQKLFIRLFGRKFQWLRQAKIVYPKIAEDLTDILAELVQAGLAHNVTSLNDLDTILVTLPAPDLRNLAKSLRIAVVNQQRADLRTAVLRHSRQSNISNFFQQKQAGTAGMIATRAKSLLGPCFKLVAECRAVFIRVMMLFSLHQITGEEDEAGGGQQQLFQILMTNIGRMVYPTYTVSRETHVFPSRQHLLRFETAVQIESNMRGAMETNDYDTAMSLYESAKPVAQKMWKDEHILKHDKSLPDFLRIYTAGSVYARILSQGVEVLQKRRDYKAAVVLLEELLEQGVYHLDYRGRWYDRLALNLDQHLKQPGKALDIVKDALAESNLRWGHRYALFQRAQRLCTSSGKKCKGLKSRWKEFEDDSMALVKEAPKVFIEGRQLPHAMPGFGVYGRVYISDESSMGGDEVTVLTRVEDVALQYYAANGYPQGIHGEGGTFRTLFGLLFWDVVFMEGVPDVFLNRYQSVPLDIGSNSFYRKRQEAVDNKLEEIRNASLEELETLIEVTWTAHEGVLGVNWERFENVEQAKGLVSCLGGAVVAGILERAVKHMSHPWGGMPDLTVWNTENKTFRLVEVKGPGDRLSTKQVLWLDYFMSIGAPAEVCHVAAVGAKKLKKLP